MTYGAWLREIWMMKVYLLHRARLESNWLRGLHFADTGDLIEHMNKVKTSNSGCWYTVTVLL